MEDKRTTITGIGIGLVALMGFFHIIISAETAILLMGLGIAVGLYFAKDKAPTS